ncbi:hypothetical protein ABT270_39025 [Streptomyces sp900105245]|uniref:hypothetical protein n=1 Tax=Streptomyces sp. 900105245 TaxID=3154379 RepID=UPI003332BF39
MADLDVAAGLYGARTIAFKAGTEFTAVDRVGALPRGAGAHRAAVRRPALDPAGARAVLARRPGRRRGGRLHGLRERTAGRAGGQPPDRDDGPADGGRIPSQLAGIAVDHLLTGRLRTPGLVPLRSRLTAPELRTALRDRGSGLWRRDDDAGDWRPWEG